MCLVRTGWGESSRWRRMTQRGSRCSCLHAQAQARERHLCSSNRQRHSKIRTSHWYRSKTRKSHWCHSKTRTSHRCHSSIHIPLSHSSSYRRGTATSLMRHVDSSALLYMSCTLSGRPCSGTTHQHTTAKFEDAPLRGQNTGARVRIPSTHGATSHSWDRRNTPLSTLFGLRPSSGTFKARFTRDAIVSAREITNRVRARLTRGWQRYTASAWACITSGTRLAVDRTFHILVRVLLARRAQRVAHPVRIASRTTLNRRNSGSDAKGPRWALGAARRVCDICIV